MSPFAGGPLVTGYPVQPGGAATGSVMWMNWCSEGNEPESMLLLLGDARMGRPPLRMPDGKRPPVPGCIDPSEPTRVQTMSVP